MTSGIYLLKFNGTDRVYIGQSKNIEKRLLEHYSSFRTGSASEKMQRAYNTYGKPSMEILLECEGTELVSAEEDAISIYNSVHSGFNTISSSGLPNTLFGDSAPSSIYDNASIIDVFNMLLDDTTYYDYKDIAKATNTSVEVVAQISGGFSHKWLESEFPEKYAKLVGMRTTREGTKRSNKNKARGSKYTDAQLIKVLKLSVSSPNLKAKEIGLITEVGTDVIRDITTLRRHKWLEQACPDEYQQLKTLKGKH